MKMMMSLAMAMCLASAPVLAHNHEPLDRPEPVLQLDEKPSGKHCQKDRSDRHDDHGQHAKKDGERKHCDEHKEGGMCEHKDDQECTDHCDKKKKEMKEKESDHCQKKHAQHHDDQAGEHKHCDEHKEGGACKHKDDQECTDHCDKKKKEMKEGDHCEKKSHEASTPLVTLDEVVARPEILDWGQRYDALQGFDTGVISFSSSLKPDHVSYIARKGGPGDAQWRVWTVNQKGEVVFLWQSVWGRKSQWQNGQVEPGQGEQHALNTAIGGITHEYLDPFWRILTASFVKTKDRPMSVRHNWVRASYGGWAFNPEMGMEMPEQVAMKLFSSKDLNAILDIQSLELQRAQQAPHGWPLRGER